ncbi:MAG: hypothetical protein LBD41_06030, partial [Clostridiales Family XIII bacterium]|nr:hypothetical protein [Clostridiales Family XIII bacterium]
MIAFIQKFKNGILAISVIGTALIASIVTPAFAQQVVITDNSELLTFKNMTTSVTIYVKGGSTPVASNTNLVIQERSPGQVDISKAQNNRGVIIGGIILNSLGVEPTVSGNKVTVQADNGFAAATAIVGSPYNFGYVSDPFMGTLTLIGGAVFNNANPGIVEENTVVVGEGAVSGKLAGSIVGGYVHRGGKAINNNIYLAEEISHNFDDYPVTGDATLNIVGGIVTYLGIPSMTDLTQNVVSGNTVNLSNGFAITSVANSPLGQELIAGGLVTQGTAGGKNLDDANVVNITGGEFTGDNLFIMGGLAAAGTSQNNIVDISGGSFEGVYSITGGYVIGSTSEYGATVLNNKVKISEDAKIGQNDIITIIAGGTVSEIYDTVATVKENSVNISLDTNELGVVAILGALVEGLYVSGTEDEKNLVQKNSVVITGTVHDNNRSKYTNDAYIAGALVIANSHNLDISQNTVEISNLEVTMDYPGAGSIFGAIVFDDVDNTDITGSYNSVTLTNVVIPNMVAALFIDNGYTTGNYERLTENTVTLSNVEIQESVYAVVSGFDELLGSNNHINILEGKNNIKGSIGVNGDLTISGGLNTFNNNSGETQADFLYALASSDNTFYGTTTIGVANISDNSTNTFKGVTDIILGTFTDDSDTKFYETTSINSAFFSNNSNSFYGDITFLSANFSEDSINTFFGDVEVDIATFEDNSFNIFDGETIANYLAFSGNSYNFFSNNL